MEQNEYMVISYSCCSMHGETEIDSYPTLEEAEKNACKGDKVVKLIKEM